jgi:hypothetical protein
MLQLDDLSGRGLDALVAQRVFGFKVEEKRNARTGEKDFVYALRSEGSNPEWVRVPQYSVSMGASISVEVALGDRGWKRRGVALGSSWNEPTNVRVTLEHADGRAVEALGLMNEALCRAALKAVEDPSDV